MTVLEIFENVSIKVPLEQRRFFDFLNNSIDELEALYHTQYVFYPDAEPARIKNLYDGIDVMPLYHPAIVDNIIYLSGQDETDTYKSEFLRKSKEAYLRYWEAMSKGRVQKRGRR